MIQRTRIFLGTVASVTLAFSVQVSAVSVSHVAKHTLPQFQTRTATDNSTITVEDSNGTRIETRTFNDPNSFIARIIRTTDADGTRRTRVYYRNGQVRPMNEGTDENVLEETGDAIAGAAETAVDVTKDVAGDTAETTVDVVQRTGAVAGAVRERTVEGAKATVEAGKDVAKETGTVAQRAGSATGKTVEKTVEVGGKVAKGTGRVVAKGVNVTGAAAEKTVDVAGDVASGTAKTAEKTAEGAATAASKTVDAAESTGNAMGRGLRAIGRGFKRIFGS